MSFQDTVNSYSYKDYITSIITEINIGKLENAYAICLEARQNHPSSLAFYYFIVVIFFKNGDHEKALHFAAQAFDFCARHQIPQEELVYVNDLGAVLLDMNQLAIAEKCFLLSLKLITDNYPSAHNLVKIYLKLRKFEVALELLKKIQDKHPCFDVFYNMAMCCCHLKFWDEAKDYLYKCIELNREDWRPYHTLGCIFYEKHQVDEAIENLNKSLGFFSGNSNAYYVLSQIKKYIKNKKNNSELRKKAENFIKNNFLSMECSAEINHALGSLYEAEGDHEKAFARYNVANIAKSNYSTCNIQRLLNAGERTKNVFNSKFIAEKLEFGSKSKIPCFIVGVMRSGTTLTEQILSSHSKITGLGETRNVSSMAESISPEPDSHQITSGYPEILQGFTKGRIEDISEQYLSKIIIDNPNIEKIFDKMPENFFYVGFIKLMFPHAVIINCKRHPLDIIVSMFSTNFMENNFPCGLEAIAEYYKFYDNMMQHWHQVFPGQIYDNHYEELVYKQEEKSRELLSLCDVEWEDSCMEFYRNNKTIFTASKFQVKEPMYMSSVFRWKKYDKYLGDIKNMLSKEISDYENEILKRVPQLAD